MDLNFVQLCENYKSTGNTLEPMEAPQSSRKTAVRAAATIGLFGLFGVRCPLALGPLCSKRLKAVPGAPGPPGAGARDRRPTDPEVKVRLVSPCVMR